MMDTQQLAVFTGPLNSGKSTLINTLLGLPVLPVDIVASTLRPTEIGYGENVAWSLRDGSRQRLGLGDLRRPMDLQGVTRLAASCASPFLQTAPGLRLLDTPGLDAVPESGEEAVRGALPAASACVLVFSADEPVVRQGTAVFLSGLPLGGVPVLAVLAKGEKLPEPELASAAGRLRAQLRLLPGLENVDVLRLSSRTGQGLDKLRAFLIGAVREDAAVPTVAARPESVPVAVRADRPPRREERRHRMDEERRRFDERIREGGAQLDGALARLLEDADRPLEALLFLGQDPFPYVDELLREAVGICVGQAFEPAAHGWLRTIAALTGRDAGEAPQAPPCPEPFPGLSTVLYRTLTALREQPRYRRRQAAAEASAALLPTLHRFAARYAAQELSQRADLLRGMAGRIADGEGEH